MTNGNLTICVCACAAVLSGCVFTRYSAMPQVRKMETHFSTRFRYWLEEYRPPSKYDCNQETRKIFAGELRKAMESEFPGVFSKDGMPFVVIEGGSEFKQGDSGVSLLNALCFFGTGYMFPRFLHNYRDTQFSIEMVEDENVYDKVAVKYAEDSVAALSPLPMLFYNGAPDNPTGRHCFYERKYGTGSTLFSVDSNKKALAFAIAAKLKEMEDAGRLEGVSEKVAQGSKLGSALAPGKGMPSSEQPGSKYRVMEFSRDTTKRFLYRFVLELSGRTQGSLRSFMEIQHELRVAVKEDFVGQLSDVDPGSVYVDFPRFDLKDGRIDGMAVVLKVKKVKLDFVSGGSGGTLTVNVVPEQIEYVKKWLRTNLNTLIGSNHDFRISLVEVADGNTLKVTFQKGR